MKLRKKNLAGFVLQKHNIQMKVQFIFFFCATVHQGSNAGTINNKDDLLSIETQ